MEGTEPIDDILEFYHYGVFVPVERLRFSLGHLFYPAIKFCIDWLENHRRNQMPTRRFSTGQDNKPSKLDQQFSFTGKLRGSDVLRRLVEICGYDLLRRTLDEWETAGQPPAKDK